MAEKNSGSEQRMTIGEVAKSYQLSNRTLRYYEEKGILKPIYCKENGYRYYGPNQLFALDMILYFRQLDVSVEEMLDCFNDGMTKDQLLLKFQKQRDKIARHIEKEQKKQQALDQLLEAFASQAAASDGKIQIKNMEPTTRVRFQIASFSSEEERERYFSEVLTFIWEHFEESYPVLYGVVSTEKARSGQLAYDCVEYECARPLQGWKDQCFPVDGKEVQVVARPIPAEVCVLLVYDDVWHSMAQYYEKAFAFCDQHQLELSQELREKWAMPKINNTGEVSVWGRLEFPILNV